MICDSDNLINANDSIMKKDYFFCIFNVINDLFSSTAFIQNTINNKYMYQKYLSALLLTFSISITPLFSQNWQPLSSEELNDVVRSMAVDGAGNVYFGGSFTLAGSSPVDYLAKYNGSSWSDIGGGLPNSNGIQDIAVDPAGNVYVSNGYFESGCFCLVYYIHKWNGTSWSLLGQVNNAFISQIEVNAMGHVYAMGDFNSISGVSASKIAYFNGTNWQALGTGIGSNGSMKLFSNGDLYVANTTSAGGQNGSLAKWNGSTWSVLSSDAFNSTVWDLEEGAGGDLYAAGNFTSIGSLSANRIAKWNGSAWSVLGAGLNNLCETILYDNGTLYAGGTFTEADGNPANVVAKWNGTTWSAMGDGFTGTTQEVKDMVTGFSGNLVVGGSFSNSGSGAIMNAAKWATATVPACSNLSLPVNGAINVASFTDLTWASAGASGATGYRLSVGTTPGGTNILNNYDAGNVVSYDLPANLPYATTIYVKITPYSSAGDAVGCTEESFTTISGSACLTGGFIFETQAQINAFSTNYPGCTEIMGNVTVEECCAGNITNLEGLSQLTGIDGGLFVFVNPTLPDLEGLENLINLQGTLQILNSSLNSLSGIQNIQPAGISNLFISNNQNLSYCEVQSVCDYLGNPANTFTIYDNAPACENEDSIQIACTAVPDCTTLTNPVNGATNIAVVTDLAWNALPSATGYRLSIGTTSGGTDILNNIDVGNVTNYDPAVNFPYSTTIFVKITPYNDNGDAVGCEEESFGTGAFQVCSPALITPTDGAILDNGCTAPYQASNSIQWFFDWADCITATQYHLFVKHPSASIPVVNDSLITISEFNHIAEGSFTSNTVGWEAKIRAFDNGAWTAWSPVVTFGAEPPGTDCPPVCNSALTNPANGATNIAVTTIFNWNASGNTTGYIVKAGTTPGGTNILNNVDVGNVTSYDPPGNLPFNTTIYVSIIPYNANGNAISCTERSFTTSATNCRDLIVENLVFNYMVSSTINMTYTIKNIGSANVSASGGILLTFYKSIDNILQIGTDPVVINFTPLTSTSLAPNQSVSGTFNMAIDTIAYQYIIAFIDANSLLAECNENNNVLIKRARGGCTTPGSHNYDPIATIPTVLCLTCSDGIMNGDETGLDCGGALCIPCTSCLSGGITFTTQSQVDSFPILYPGCVVIDGDVLTSYGSNINNFSNLQQLTGIGGHLNIQGSGFPNLNGLQNLSHIGGSLSIHDTYLVSISALSQLESLGGSLIFYSNPNLTSLNGLNNLDSIGGTLHIVNNQSLNTVSALSNIQQINGELHFSVNHQTTTLSGLENIDPNGITNLEIIFNSTLNFCETPNICTYLSNPNNPFTIYNNSGNCASSAAILAVCSPGAPLCTSLTSPANGATNVSVTSALTWAASAGATGYKLTVGTTPGGTDILNNIDVGNITNFNPAGDFPYGATIYVNIIPYNGVGDALGCGEESFMTYSGLNDFVTTWKTDNPGSSNSTSITIPTTGSGYNYNVDWNNDGIFDQFGITGNITHDFGVAGTYTIRINGDFPRIYFNHGGDKLKILSVNQWGNINWTSMENAFADAQNLNISAMDSPNLTQVTNMSGMFYNADALNQDIGNWNVANVTDMSYMLSNAGSFNQDIGNWNVSNVTNMAYMFFSAVSFNQDIGSWNVANVTNMSGMFYYASAFNQNIGSWNVANVTNMFAMFVYAIAFNQNIGNWNVLNVTDMSYLFSGAISFNQDIGNWNVSSVTNMQSMLQNASSFNKDIGNWNVASVTDMSTMMYLASSFNHNIGNWNLSNVTDMANMLDYSGLSITNYDNTLIAWDLASYTNKNIGVVGLEYCNSATARNNMITNKGWTFNGDALDCSAFPVCTSLTSPLNNATNVSITSALNWSASSGATGYKLTVGTTSGGTDILHNFDVGNVTTYNPAGDYTSGATIYVKITPYNGIGDNAGCAEESFTIIGNSIPANDECINATLLPMNTGNCLPTAYSNVGATASNPGEFNCGQPDYRDIWFQLTSNDNSFNLTTGNLPAGSTAYDLFDTCGGNNITCNAIASNNSYIIAVPAGTYYLRISRPVGAPVGDIELCVWQSIPAPTLLSLTSTTAKIKYHSPISPATATSANLKIWGDETGLRSGTYTVSNDTVTFQPITPFRAGEVINITSKSSLLFTGGGATQPFSWMRPSQVYNPTAAIFDTTGTGITLPAAAYGTNASYQATMADLNQDGLQDLIYRYISSGGASTNIRVYLRNSNGSFAAAVTYNNSASYSILIGTPDLNSDGYPDIVLAHNSPSQIQVRLNNGAGGFGAATLYAVTNFCNGAKVYDLDNDGDLDIIAYAGNATLAQNTISVLKNNGNGTFAAQVTTNTSVFGTSLLPVDLDNDGDGDLAYTSSSAFSSPKVFRVYRNDGTGALSLNNSETNNQEKVLSSAFDYNGDGNVDLISRTPNTDIYLSNSGISYSLASPTTFTTDHAQTFSGDLDGDGDLDIFNANSYNGSNWNTLPLKFFLNDGSAAFSTTTTSLVLPGINVNDLSDYDGDGDLDHIYLKPNGEIGVLLNGNGAVQCPSGDLVFTTQGEIDAFPVSYPNCTQISGNVTISGAGINNLNGLSAITTIDGYLDISYNPNLTNMVGLDALSTIGGYLQVYSNAGLVRFTGLGSLTEIGDFLYIGANPDLSDLIGLEALTTIGGYLSFQDNALLGSVTGLEALTSIGAELFFEANPGLTNLNGLNALTSIGGELEILGNAGLTSLSGLEALTSIGSYLSIESNTALTSLTGLENLNPATITELYLLNSGVLSLCDVPSICDYLAIPTNPATITGNAIGCATRQEVENACNPIPFCTSLIYPTSVSTDIPVTAVLSWLVSAGATGYKLNVGTTFGGTEILNNFDVGNVTTYDPPDDFPNGTIIYVRITPYNGAGDALECGLEQFTTVPGCPQGNVTLLSQAEVDNFVSLHAGCTQINGNLDIGQYGVNSDINNITGLAAITNITGSLGISWNPVLTSLEGLHNITDIGSNITIDNNDGLTDLLDFANLNTIGGAFYIISNSSITDLQGFEGLTAIPHGLVINTNASLTDLDGLVNLQSIGLDLNILGNVSLTDLTALSNIPSVGGYLNINYNNALVSLTGLHNIATIAYGLNIEGNNSLASLLPLNGLNSIGGSLTISSNPQLSQCEAQAICNYLSIPPGAVTIQNNTNGCNSQAEVQAACPAPPSCTGLTTPAPASSNISIATNLSWSAIANATGYLFTIGTSPGGTEILNNLDVGNVTTYNPAIDFNYNTAIYVSIVPYNNFGNATGCAEQSFTTQQQSACGTLSGLTATIQSSSSVLVSWNPLSGVNAYQLRYRVVGTTTFTTIAATAATSQLINGLSPNATYEYQLRVKCNGVWSAYNSLNQFTTPETSPVPACTSLTIPANNAVNVVISTNLTWAASAGAAGYLLTIGSTPGGTDLLNNFNTGNVTTYNPPADFNFNTTIYVKIVPYNGTGNATGCTEQSFTTQQQSNCGTIAGLVAALQSPTNVLISWNSMAGVNAYQLRYRISGTTTFTTLAATAATSKLISGLMSDTNYEYQLRVKCNGVWSGYNTLSNFMTPEGSIIPACTSLTNPVNGAFNVVISSNISWAASAGATGYRLTIGTSPGGSELLNNIDVGNTTTYNPAIDFNYNAVIYVKVVPYSSAGNATGCTEQSFTTQQQSDCGTIGGLTANIQSPTSVLISWNALAGVSAYQLRYRVVGTTTFTTLGGTVATSLLITGLISETNYEYQLRIKCNGTWSAFSGLSNFTTPEIVVIPACTSLTNPVNGAINVLAGTNLTWSATAGATGYLLTIGTTPGGNDLLNNLNVGNTTTYDPVTDFNFNTTFFVKVVPFNGAGNATGCVEQNFTTQQQSDCGSINGLSVTVESPTSVLISWNPLAGVSRYQLRYRQVGTTIFISPTASAATSLQITGLSPGNTYEYQLQVRCNGIWSGFNGLSSFTTTTNCTWYADFDNDGLGSEANGTITWTCSQPANYVSNNLDCDDNTNSAICSLPAGNSVGNITSTAATISWTSSPCVTYYQVNYRVTGGAWSTPTSTVYGNTITYTGLTPGTTYQYRIRSRCDATSSVSAYVTGGFTTLTLPTGLIEDMNGDVAVSGSFMADFDIYPNPGDGIFYLRLDSELEQGSLIHLTDMMGRLVLSMEWPLYKGENIRELDLTDYAKGIYQVHIQKGETIGCKKIVLIE